MADQTKKSPYALWDHERGVIRSRAGGWIRGRGVYCRGFDMMNDLVGKVSYFQVLILNATGNLPERRLADWFEGVFICLSWPEPRIWCNQVGALAGTVRASAPAATAAGALAADSRIYGNRPLLESIPFIQNALKDKRSGASAREIVRRECARHGGKPRVMGYARPIAKGDERVPVLESLAESLGFPVGEHMTLAREIEQVMAEDFDESMNIVGYVSAFVSDQGLSAEDTYRIVALYVMSGVTACYADTAARPAEAFLPLRCEDIEYQGAAPRALPRRG